MPISKIIETLPSMTSEKRENLRKNASRLILSGSDEQKEDAREVLKALKQLEALEHQKLFERLSGMPVAARVVEAFRVERMTETEEKVIRVLLDNPGANSSELSQALGWDGQSWHMHFGTMCCNRSTYLWPSPKIEQVDADFFSGILAELSDEGHWQMKPDVKAAFREIGVQ